MSKDYSITQVVWDFIYSFDPFGKRYTEHDGRNLSWSRSPFVIMEYMCSGIEVKENLILLLSLVHVSKKMYCIRDY